jgi:hypothetical protein
MQTGRMSVIVYGASDTYCLVPLLNRSGNCSRSRGLQPNLRSDFDPHDTHADVKCKTVYPVVTITRGSGIHPEIDLGIPSS